MSFAAEEESKENLDCSSSPLLNLSTIFVVDVKVVLYLSVSRDSSMCFPISHCCGLDIRGTSGL